MLKLKSRITHAVVLVIEWGGDVQGVRDKPSPTTHYLYRSG